MTSSKPYLIRAIYEWIEDNGLTPYLYVNTERASENLRLPEHLLSESPLVLSISSSACVDLLIENDAISFQARFSGEVFDVYLPMSSILAIISRENGEGMSFPDELEEVLDERSEDEADENNGDIAEEITPKRSSLKVVK